MTIQWQYQQVGAVAVVTITGHLGKAALHRFNGAMGWVLTRADTVILDITDLHGWSPEGREAILTESERLAAYGQSLELAGPSPDGDLPGIPHHQDLAAALRENGVTL
ncbi:hypothetical protein ACQHIV_38010 [Kribbella sp. GL6]|uniref:hypothetical protein n=1 Tax=Kribbella sp. GL6 TaxID=3419765 RepID=UPI003D00E542